MCVPQRSVIRRELLFPDQWLASRNEALGGLSDAGLSGKGGSRSEEQAVHQRQGAAVVGIGKALGPDEPMEQFGIQGGSFLVVQAQGSMRGPKNSRCDSKGL